MQSYVPEHVTLNLLGYALVVSALVSALAGFSFACFEGPANQYIGRAFRNTLRLLGFGFPVALVAFVAGYLSTMGRTSAVGTVLPAVLSLIGGLNIYIFGTDSKYRVLISYCVVLFAGMLLYGTQYGSYRRDLEQEFRLNELIKVEARIRLIRKNLDLADDFPSWIIGAEPK